MADLDNDLKIRLLAKAIEVKSNSGDDIQKVCWMVVHEHHHGVMPSEYDIRPIDETLYLSVLESLKQELG
ncbi:hypothetical protein [Prochlorococcus marinus]|uniref:hypothetical protein n=1 Tax=Prochlorococcus marinus TaxID=1219 RepID=UPI0022B500BD|nr:hypothetical protein [Prochlorococcus marinus]